MGNKGLNANGFCCSDSTATGEDLRTLKKSGITSKTRGIEIYDGARMTSPSRERRTSSRFSVESLKQTSYRVDSMTASAS
jgi:hypothetical protein